jgi:hypothetical protein
MPGPARRSLTRLNVPTIAAARTAAIPPEVSRAGSPADPSSAQKLAAFQTGIPMGSLGTRRAAP